MIHSVARRVTDCPCLMGLGKGCRRLGNSTPAAGLLLVEILAERKSSGSRGTQKSTPGQYVEVTKGISFQRPVPWIGDLQIRSLA